MLDDKTKKMYEEWGVPLPTSETHGTDEDIRAKLKPMLPTKWRQEGDMLIAETSDGVHAQKIPTSHILVNTDNNGMPVFRKIVL